MKSGGEEKEKPQKGFFESSKKPVIIEGFAKHGNEFDPSGCDELGEGGGKEKIFKNLFRASKNRVIVEGFADRSKQDARQKLSSVRILKNIQPISVGV